MMRNKNTSTQPEKNENRASVYEESMEMLIGSVIIYIFAELRDMIREGKLVDLKLEELTPPLNASRTLEIIQTHRKALQERAVDHEYLESRLSALQQVYHQKSPGASFAGRSSNFLFQYLCGSSKEGGIEIEAQEQNDTVVLKHFVDHNAKEELVHAVVVNPIKRRITVIFRGSVTPKDFLQDAKCAQKKVDNPVLACMPKGATVTSSEGDEIAMPTKIGIHTGFYEYLFFPSKEGKDTKNEKTTATRLGEILSDVKALLKEEEYTDFSLYITGHSLGGALSTLCAFYAACDNELISLVANHRVIIYSIASPYCGNWKFRHAFQELERQRRVQHLRIANLEDMVTLLPFAVPKATFLSPALSLVKGAGNLYKHVGIKLQIRKTVSTKGSAEIVEHSIAYPKEHQCEDDQEYAKELQDAMEAGKSLARAFYYLCKSDFVTVEKYHSCDEYEERLDSCQVALKGRTLDEFYEDPKIVGKLFTQDYQPSLLSGGGISRAFRALSILNKSGKKSKTALEPQDDAEEMTLTEAAMVASK